MILSIQKKLCTFRKRDPSLRCDKQSAILSLELPIARSNVITSVAHGTGTARAIAIDRAYRSIHAHNTHARMYICTGTNIISPRSI